MDLLEHEKPAVEILNALGLMIEKIQENSISKTCDFRISNDTSPVLIEHKSRNEDEDFIRDLQTRKIVSRTRPLYRSNRIANIVKEAVKQLDSLGHQGNEVKLLWFSLLFFPDPEVAYDQIFATVYGSSGIVHIDTTGKAISTDCLYFNHSSFHRYPQLAGVIIDQPKGLTFFKNNFSPMIQSLEHLRLYCTFDSDGGVFKPHEAEKNGAIFIADTDEDRNDRNLILAYIKNKYRLKYAYNIEPQSHEAYTRIPRNSPKRPKSSDEN